MSCHVGILKIRPLKWKHHLGGNLINQVRWNGVDLSTSSWMWNKKRNLVTGRRATVLKPGLTFAILFPKDSNMVFPMIMRTLVSSPHTRGKVSFPMTGDTV